VLPNAKEFPNWGKATPIEVIQEQGEAIFVPSKWHHQVINLEDTISINHNWGNACNLEFMLDYLIGDYNTVVEVRRLLRNRSLTKRPDTGYMQSISDLKDTFESEAEFGSHVMQMLKANSGMDLHDFSKFLRFHEQRCSTTLASSGSSHARKNLMEFNLRKIRDAKMRLALGAPNVKFDD
jgi:hypothetical protein